MITADMKAKWCTDKGVTLNGKPARISGSANQFATVRDTESGLSAEWSWEAVRRVMAKGGAFKS